MTAPLKDVRGAALLEPPDHEAHSFFAPELGEEDHSAAHPLGGGGAQQLVVAHHLLPEVARERAVYEAASVQAAGLDDETPEPPRRGRMLYRAVIVTTGLAIATAVFWLLCARHSLGLSAALAGAVAVHAGFVAHLSGRWIRRPRAEQANARTWWARGLVLSVLCEAGALFYVAFFERGSLAPLGVIAACATIAWGASWMRHRADRDVERRLRARDEAAMRLAAAKAHLTAEVAKARASFEAEAVALEQAAAYLDAPSHSGDDKGGHFE